MPEAVSSPAKRRASALPLDASSAVCAASTAITTIGKATIRSTNRVSRPRKLTGILSLNRSPPTLRLSRFHARRHALRGYPCPRAPETPGLTLGAIAQLEERLDRTQEVAGSSPASSIEEARRT